MMPHDSLKQVVRDRRTPQNPFLSTLLTATPATSDPSREPGIFASVQPNLPCATCTISPELATVEARYL